MSKTAIEWATAVLNAATGCDEVSDGCDRCYARVMAERLRAMGQAKYRNGFEYTEHPEVFDQLGRWKKPERVFVNSMSDFFHERATWEFVQQAFDAFRVYDRHTYLILTKRPGRMRSWVERYCLWAGLDVLPGHIWLGVSAENQQWADIRIPYLLGTKCQVRFVSAEPLLGPLDLESYLRPIVSLPPGYRPALDWVIAGGESGAGARPMAAEWATGLRDQCREAGVSYFFKQWGGAHHAAGGRLLDGRTWDEIPAQGAA